MRSYTRREIKVYGQDISFLEAGDGPHSVVLLHGITSDACNWLGTIPALAKAGFRVIAPDHLGFGSSSKPTLPLRPATLADMLGAIIHTLGLERPSLVGQSMGGHVAGILAARNPERINRLVLSNAGYALALPTDGEIEDCGHSNVPGALRLFNPATRAEAKALLEMVFHDKPRFISSESVDKFFALRLAALDGGSIGSIVESWKQHADALDPLLSKLGMVPTLIIQSENDEVAPKHLGEKLHRDIPGSCFVLIKNCGHEPALEATEEYNNILIGFLQD